ncbi:MAG TPA: DUF1616 domain-containing protein [Solirubrobacterales bacterium]
MRRLAGRAGNDLLLVAVSSVASLALMALPIDGLVIGLVLVPLTLVLPGYAVAAMLFPSRSPAGAERVVYVFAFSVSTAALGGLVWQLAFGLGRFAWAGILTLITLACCAVAARRRATPRPGRRVPRPQLHGLDAPSALGALAAIGLAIFAIWTAVDGLQDQRADSKFTALWIIPQEEEAGGVEIGISNHQAAVHRYRLTVEGAGTTIREWEGRLGSRQQLRLDLEPFLIPAGARLVVTLYRDGSLYRRTKLQTEVGA